MHSFVATLYRALRILSTTLLRRIPLNVRAISAKNIYQKTTHSTVTFQMLFETSHSSSLAQVTPR